MKVNKPKKGPGGKKELMVGNLTEQNCIDAIDIILPDRTGSLCNNTLRSMFLVTFEYCVLLTS